MYGTPAAPLRPRSDPPPEDPELAIPLTRRNLGTPPVPNVSLEGAGFAQAVDIGPPAVERVLEPARSRATRRGDSEPVLDLRRRKPHSAPSLAPSTTEPAIADQMLEARDRDQILDLLVSGTLAFARRAVVLAVRRDMLVGWTGAGRDPGTAAAPRGAAAERGADRLSRNRSSTPSPSPCASRSTPPTRRCSPS